MKEQNLQSVCPCNHSGVPMVIGIKVETPPAGPTGKEGEGLPPEQRGSEFIINIPYET